MNTEIKKYIEEKASIFIQAVKERTLNIYFNYYNIIGGDKDFKKILMYQNKNPFLPFAFAIENNAYNEIWERDFATLIFDIKDTDNSFCVDFDIVENTISYKAFEKDKNFIIEYEITLKNKALDHHFLCLKYNFKRNFEKSSFLRLNLHSHSFRCKINFSSVRPLNFASLLLAKLQKLSIPLTCDFPLTNSFSW